MIKNWPLLLILLITHDAQAMVQYNHHTLSIQGYITPHTKSTFLTLAEQHHIDTVTLNSQGGNLDAALAMARYTAKHHIHTHAQGICNSACSIFFLAGRFPTATKHTVICIHRAYRNQHGQYIGEPRYGDYFTQVANTLGIERGTKQGKILTEMMWDVSPHYCSAISTSFGYRIKSE